MVIIGFDPGSIAFGVGIVGMQNKNISYIHAETIRLTATAFYMRMQTLCAVLTQLINQYAPETAALEEGFLGKNTHSMSILAMVRGVVMGQLIERHIPLACYAPREIKKSLTGYGQASKEQVQKMVLTLLKIGKNAMTTDASDALAVAYCHALMQK